MTTDKRLEVLTGMAEELVSKEEFADLLKTKEHPVAYDGFEPSGLIHIAQGLHRAQTIKAFTDQGVRFKVLIADWHAMINNKMGGDLEKIQKVGEYFIEVWRSCGLDPDQVEFVWASDLVQDEQYWQTVLQLSMNASVQRVLRCGQIMGREDSTANPSAQIIYPLMQAADMIHLGVDIAQLGLDQRKVNMLARDIFPKLERKKPVAFHHHMLLGLQFTDTDAEGHDRKVAMKMSKSKPETAIFMTDTKEDVERKFKKAYSVDGQVEDNPVLDYVKHIIFAAKDHFHVDRPEKFGGPMDFSSYEAVEEAFAKQELKSIDLKQAVAQAVNELLEPTRRHFQEDPKAKALLDEISQYQVTR